MNESWLPRLRCPRTHEAYDLDPSRAAGPEVSEGFLVAAGGREPRPILAGVPVLPFDLRAHLRAFGNVYERMPLGDSRVVRFVLGQAGHRDHDLVPFAELVTHYGDLVPADRTDDPVPLAADDAALAGLLATLGRRDAPALYVGCGVGRGVFVLRDYCAPVMGVDRSIARVRRARNVAVTKADFFLPPAPGAARKEEVALELDRLARTDVDFAVADAEHLPFVDGAFGLVVLRAGDGRGPWADPVAVGRECVRVLTADAVLVLEEAESPGSGWTLRAEVLPFRAWGRA